MDAMAEIEDWWQRNFDTDNCFCNALLPNGQPMYAHGCKAENHLDDDDKFPFSEIRKEFNAWLNEQEEIFNNIPKNQPVKAHDPENGGNIYTQRSIMWEALFNLTEKFSVVELMQEKMHFA